MATITPVRSAQHGKTYHYIWETMTETNDAGDAVSNPGARDRSIHVNGTFGGATVELWGSNMLTPVLATADHWVRPHDGQGNVVGFTVAGCEAIAENMLWYKIQINGGTGTDVDVMLLAGSVI